MGQTTQSNEAIRFEGFELNPQTGELRKHGIRLNLQDQPFKVLVALIQRPGEMVTREELRQLIWPEESFGDFDHAINRSIAKLRSVLGDSPEVPHLIETLPRRGYRFIGTIDGQLKESVEPLPSRTATASTASVEAPTGADVITTPGTPPLQREGGALPYMRWTPLVGGVLAVTAVGAFITWFITHRAPLPAPQLTERRLTANPSEVAVTEGAISPDGKYLAYGDAVGLHLKLIQTGETANIPQPEGPGAPSAGGWWPNGWFPDGSKFIAAGLAPNQPVSAWVVPVIGGPPRKLRDDADLWSVSPDGKLIAFGTGRAFIRVREIWLMGAQGEEPRRLASGSEDDGFFWTAWSPDGQRIAYKRFHRTPEGLECSIESRDLEGGQPTLILSDPTLCNVGTKFLWFPDGRLIYIPYEPDQGFNLSEIRVDTRTGRALSKPRRLTNWVGMVAWGISGTLDGRRLAVTKAHPEADVYAGELEANGRRVKNTRRLTLNENDDYPGQWTPDSKAVLFWSDRNGTWDIFKQALDQADAQPVVTGPDVKRFPVMSPDGSWILYLSSATARVGATTPVRIMRVPTSGGAPQLVLEGRGINGLACAQPPATNCVFGEEAPDATQLIFSGFDPAQGRGQELTRIKLRRQYSRARPWDLSPDGTRVALAQYDIGEGRIEILPLAGGEAHEVYVQGRSRFGTLHWAADGKGLLVGVSADIPPRMVLYVDLEGRAEVLWQQPGAGVGQTAGIASPDGRHLALLGWGAGDFNVWMLEGF